MESSSNIFEELGIPKKYLKSTSTDNTFIALVHKAWLKSLVKHSKLGDFIEKSRLESWPSTVDECGPSWTKIFLRVFKKRDAKVIPLPRIRTLIKDDPPLLYPQLMQYIYQTNFRNLWKEAYKKYNPKLETSKETQVTLTDYNEVLKEIIVRIYGCPIVNVYDSRLNQDVSKQFDVHLNILPAICAVETLNAVFLLHNPFIEHNLKDCVTFSPAILDKCFTKPLFIIHQLLNTLKSLHDHSLTLGDISLSDIYLSEDMWIYILPAINSNIYVQDLCRNNNNNKSKGDCRKSGHRFDSASSKCDNCGLRTYDKVQISDESLEKLCQLWVDNQISNFTYISALNKSSGRKLGDPNCHHVFPWVTDFVSRCGKNWRDLKKSKFRLNKGDRQLDLTYESTQSEVPHHVSDVLSSITYYVYMARRTPKSVLCKNVRTVWVPAEYPSSIQRLQEWTPDECIPEFFTDPSVFRSIHDDLEDLEVPNWASGPEDFVERHREALESPRVSERLHHWIDLTFGYKLAGNPAVKSKNVCLSLVDEHSRLTKAGIVQLFGHPHPPKASVSAFWGKAPPKIYLNKPGKQKERDRSCSPGMSLDEEDGGDDSNMAAGSKLGLSRLLSRSRSSLNEEMATSQAKPKSSQSGQRNQRSASLGPKNPSFTSHVVQKSTKPGQLSMPTSSLSTGIIYLPKEYKPDLALDLLEKKHSFLSKTFHVEVGRKLGRFDNTSEIADKVKSDDTDEDDVVQNAFTNRIFSDNFAFGRRNNDNNALKSLSFPLDNRNTFLYSHKSAKTVATSSKNDSIICNYGDIISSRRIRELQILGCLIVEIFMSKQLRALGTNSDSNSTLSERLKSCLTVVKSCRNEVPPCVAHVIELLLRPENDDKDGFKYPPVTEMGLPPPSAHLLLEPLLHCIIPFPRLFRSLYEVVGSLKDFKNAALSLDVLYHFDCDGEMCAEYENLERTKILFAQNIGECKVKSCTKSLEGFLDELNPTTDSEIVDILLPHIKELIEDPPTSVLAAWYLFDSISRVLGPQKTGENLLDSVLKLYENEPNELTLPYNGKIAKLYHHSFLLRLIVRLGLRTFLDNFVAPLVEAVGRYKDNDRFDFVLHTHCEKTAKKSHLKTMDNDNNVDMSTSDDSSQSSEKKPVLPTEPEVFDFDEEIVGSKTTDLNNVIEQLELNVASDLPFNHSNAEEALDATLTENLEQLRSLEELKINLTDEEGDLKVASPTIQIPSKSELFSNISCEVGSKKSENDFDKKSGSSTQYELDSPSNNSSNNFDGSKKSSNSIKSTRKSNQIDTKISDMSADSLIWLSHRLGPVLTARYLSRNLLKMLTLCYVGKDNLTAMSKDDGNTEIDNISVVNSYVIGDYNAMKVLGCLTSMAGLYGEQLILFQYIPHMSELIALCKRKLTPNLEGGLISSLALLKHIIPYLSDATLMDQLQDVILKNILHPTVRLLGSTKYTFPGGCTARNVLARKYLDTLYVLSIRMGSDMTRTHLAVPALQRFFLIFDKIHNPNADHSINDQSHKRELETSTFLELCRDGSTAEWAVGGRPVQIQHVRLKESEFDSLSPPVTTAVNDDDVNWSLEELKAVFTPELAYIAYLPFLKHVGALSLDGALKNHDAIRALCRDFEQRNGVVGVAPSDGIPITVPSVAVGNMTASSSIGSNISLVGNRIDVEGAEDADSPDLLSLVSSRTMENSARHLRGNWLAYWEHEIGRSDKDAMFNFKQIKLQTFAGHAHSVKCLHALDNENSFASGSRDKTVKLWSLRSQGDGSNVTTCQWTYTAHKKSVLSLTFVESMRLVASCDSVVHIWDPFMGANVGNLESAKFAPVNVLKSLPAPSSLFYAATTDGTVKVVDSRLCNYVYELKVSLSPAGLIRCLAVSPSGLWVAAGQSSGNVTVLDSRTGLVIATWRAHEGEVLQLVALDDSTLISTSLDQTISVWSASDGRFRFHMRGATEPVHCLNVYNNELISGTTANRIGVHTSIDLEASFSSTKLRSDAFKGLLTSMALLPLNRLLLLGADTGNISLLC